MSTAPKKRVAKKVTPETKNESVPTPNHLMEGTTISEVESLRMALTRKESIINHLSSTIDDLRSKSASPKQKMETAIEKIGNILEDFEYHEGLEILAKTRKVIMRQAEDKCADSEKAVDYFRNLRSY